MSVAKTASREQALLTIGAVCEQLKGDFPDISISKIRYLEDQGLIAPQRTRGGYRLFGEDGADRLYGGDANYLLVGGAGVDRIYAEAGNDVLAGGPSNDKLYGDAGDDTLLGLGQNDLLNGGEDDDEWFTQIGEVPAGILNAPPLTNTLRIAARNDAGGAGGDLDDFVVDNVVILYRMP